MKIGFKRIAAAAAAAALAISLCGCSDKGYLMKVDGTDIRNGIYLSFLQTAYSNAAAKINEELDASGEYDESETVDIFKQSVEGKTASEWIKADAQRLVRRFIAVQRLCEQYGIELSEEEINEINSELKSSWDTENAYFQYFYGFNTMGEMYESQGIGIDSMRALGEASALSDKLFMHYYGKGGEREVADSEIDSYIKENYAAYKLIELEYKDYKGFLLTTDEEKQAVKDKADDYARRLNGGESFADIKYEIDLQAARDKAKSDAEDEYTSDNEEGLSEEEFVQKAVDAAAAEKAESEEKLDQFISKKSSSLSEELTQYIWNAADDGKAAVFEMTASVYIVVREDVTQKASWKENMNESILREMKSEQYESVMELTFQNYSVEQNDYLVNNKYAPEKLK